MVAGSNAVSGACRDIMMRYRNKLWHHLLTVTDSGGVAATQFIIYTSRANT